jgi:hypothetical protein
MLKNELRQAYLSRLENRWLVDGCGGSFMKIVRRSDFPGLQFASQGNTKADSPRRLVFWVESLIDDGRFSEPPLAFPEGFLDGDYVASRELVAELEAILKASVANLEMPVEHWIEQAGKLDARQKAMALAQPRLASAVIPGAQFGFAYTGAFRTRLGMLLELWEAERSRPPCPLCGGKLLFFSAGALLSTSSARGYCMNCKKVSTMREDLGLRLYCEAGKLERARTPEKMPLSIGAAFRILEAKGVS